MAAWGWPDGSLDRKSDTTGSSSAVRPLGQTSHPAAPASPRLVFRRAGVALADPSVLTEFAVVWRRPVLPPGPAWTPAMQRRTPCWEARGCRVVVPDQQYGPRPRRRLPYRRPSSRRSARPGPRPRQCRPQPTPRRRWPSSRARDSPTRPGGAGVLVALATTARSAPGYACRTVGSSTLRCHGTYRPDWFGPLGTMGAFAAVFSGRPCWKRCLADLAAPGHPEARSAGSDRPTSIPERSGRGSASSPSLAHTHGRPAGAVRFALAAALAVVPALPQA